ncbi:hypothetical protein FBQ82_19445 [Anaerolineae bacterium CFX7]|nr:hypothetical protein [Anaerolineae bacterium CFX7]
MLNTMLVTSSMMSPLLIFFGGAFALTLGLGFWVGRTGKPYNGVLFNLHKLLALGAVIAAAISIYNFVTTAPGDAPRYLLFGVGGVCVLALFVSGALMSAGKSNQTALRALHRIGVVIIIIAIAGMLFAGTFA